MPRVGLISDTHGLLRPEAVTFLRGSDFIVHAGDVGDPKVIERLENLAPVTVVRGNNDKGPWADAIAETEVLEVGDVRIYVLHNIAELDLDPSVTTTGSANVPSTTSITVARSASRAVPTAKFPRPRRRHRQSPSTEPPGRKGAVN